MGPIKFSSWYWSHSLWQHFCFSNRERVEGHFFLRPSAKDQGITWVVLVHHLVHFLKKWISVKKIILPSVRISSLGFFLGFFLLWSFIICSKFYLGRIWCSNKCFFFLSFRIKPGSSLGSCASKPILNWKYWSHQDWCSFGKTEPVLLISKLSL